MSSFNYRAGIGNVGSYQASTKPFLSASIPITGSTRGTNVVKIPFPFVTQYVTIENAGVEGVSDCYMRVGFSRHGINNTNNYLVLNNGESYSADWRVSALYLRVEDTASFVGETTLNATASVIAGLTNIEADQLTNNWSGSVGVG